MILFVLSGFNFIISCSKADNHNESKDKIYNIGLNLRHDLSIEDVDVLIPNSGKDGNPEYLKLHFSASASGPDLPYRTHEGHAWIDIENPTNKSVNIVVCSMIDYGELNSNGEWEILKTYGYDYSLYYGRGAQIPGQVVPDSSTHSGVRLKEKYHCEDYGITSSPRVPVSYHFGCRLVHIPANDKEGVVDGKFRFVTMDANGTETPLPFTKENLGMAYIDILIANPGVGVKESNVFYRPGDPGFPQGINYSHVDCNEFNKEPNVWLLPSELGQANNETIFGNIWAGYERIPIPSMSFSLSNIHQSHWPAGNWYTMNRLEPTPAGMESMLAGFPPGTSIMLDLPDTTQLEFVIPESSVSSDPCKGATIDFSVPYLIPASTQRHASITAYYGEVDPYCFDSGFSGRFEGLVYTEEAFGAYQSGQFMHAVNAVFSFDLEPPEIFTSTAKRVSEGIAVKVISADASSMATGAYVVFKQGSTEYGPYAVDYNQQDPITSNGYSQFEEVFLSSFMQSQGMMFNQPINYRIIALDDSAQWSETAWKNVN